MYVILFSYYKLYITFLYNVYKMSKISVIIKTLNSKNNFLLNN